MTVYQLADSPPAASAAVAPRLAARGLAFSHGDRPVLADVTFDVRPGELLGVLGRNGAGKSTLFSILAGLLPPRAGTLALDGVALGPRSRALRARMGVAFQDPSLDPKLTCEENVALAAALHRVPGRERRERVRAMLALAGLEDRAGDAAEKLSGGLRRRLELARALVARPAILLADEPTTGLDAAAFRRFWEAIERLRRDEGLTALVATHRPEEAERCDRLAILAGGRVVACETPAALRARVAGDVIEVAADGALELAAEIATRFGVKARATPRGVFVERARGHELVPRLVEAFPPGRFQAISLHPPTLSDAFLALTGEALEEEAP